MPVRRDPLGLTGPTPWAARGRDWRASSRGLYVPARVDRTTEQRILEASAALPDHGGVTGWAGLAWHRASWFGGLGPSGLERPVTLVVAGTRIRPQPGVAVSQERLDPRDLTVHDGVRTTLPVRSAWFEMRYAAGPRQAAVALSMAAYSDLVSIDEMLDYSHEHPGWTGAPVCRSGISLSYENCWSPMEVEVANVWHVDAELPRLRCNEPLFDRRGRHIATPDFFDDEAGVAIEYDGSHHLRLAQRAKDLDRAEVFRGLGIEFLVVLAPHLADPWALVDRMRAVRRRATFLAESARTWTTELPPWWVPTHTVALRRELTEQQRSRLLRYRSAA